MSLAGPLLELREPLHAVATADPHCLTALIEMLVGGSLQFSVIDGLVQVRLLPLTVPDTASVPVQGVLAVDVQLDRIVQSGSAPTTASRRPSILGARLQRL